jgi:hypothetical protein
MPRVGRARAPNQLQSTSKGDVTYEHMESTRTYLDTLRDAVAGQMKLSLDSAAFANHAVLDPGLQVSQCEGLLKAVDHLAVG